MPLIRLTLNRYLQDHGVTPAALASATAPRVSRNTVYRLLRQEEEITRIDLPTLTVLILTLRRLTGQQTEISDLLSLIPETTGGKGQNRASGDRKGGRKPSTPAPPDDQEN